MGTAPGTNARRRPVDPRTGSKGRPGGWLRRRGEMDERPWPHRGRIHSHGSPQEEDPARPGPGVRRRRASARRVGRGHDQEAVEGFVENTALPALDDASEKAGPAVAGRPREGRAAGRRRPRQGRARRGRRRRSSPEAAAQAKEAADAKVASLRGEEPQKKGGKLRSSSCSPPSPARSGSSPRSSRAASRPTTGSRPTSRSPPRTGPRAGPGQGRRRLGPRRGDRGRGRGPAPGHHAGRPRRRRRRRRAPTSPPPRRPAQVASSGRRQLGGPVLRRSRGRSAPTSRTASRSARRGPRGSRRAATFHQRMTMRLSIGSSRQMSPTVSTWSRPVCATRTTSASGAASRAAMNPPGRGASTLVIASARSAILSRPSLRSRSMPRVRRPVGEVAALGEDHERVVLVEPASPGRRSAPRGRRRPAGVMNRAGIRCSSTSIIGSQASVFLRTTRGSRPYQCISAWIRTNESPGPGVPAADQDRQAGVRVGARAVGDDVEVQHPLGLAEEHPHHALDEVVVDALPVRRAQPRARSRWRARSRTCTTSSSASITAYITKIQSSRSARQRPGSSGESAAARDQPQRQEDEEHPDQHHDGRRQHDPSQQRAHRCSSR